ncbi:MAG: hypothetical protein K2X76_01615 [Sphingomonas sp.]|nr:hypothetical protein [Sphingomonas sp.]
MSYIAATAEYGLILRKGALAEKGISPEILSDIMADIDVFGEDENLISYGPLFGEEVLEEIKARLSANKLDYVDDYFELNMLLPHWVKLGVELA